MDSSYEVVKLRARKTDGSWEILRFYSEQHNEFFSSLNTGFDHSFSAVRLFEYESLISVFLFVNLNSDFASGIFI